MVKPDTVFCKGCGDEHDADEMTDGDENGFICWSCIADDTAVAHFAEQEDEE